MEPQSDSSASSSNPPAAASATSATPAGSWNRFGARWLKRLSITAVILLVVFAGFLLLAEHRTSQPEFCGSCHIMEPYYESWHADPHGGKLDIACVDCHYAPGERTTIKAKLRGLSQVTSYFSGRYGASRPRAHVDNRSCLTSRCHGDMKFMDKELSLGTVKFTHANHLIKHAEKLQENEKSLQNLTEQLDRKLGKERMGELTDVARVSGPAKERMEQMLELMAQWEAEVSREELQKYSELHHRHVRLAQLAELQCTSCHSYVAPDSSAAGSGGAHHFSVKTTSCYTCHFNNEAFNSGTGECLLCHSLPTKEILVHRELTPAEADKLTTPELGEDSIRMDHRTILERKVDCMACHADVAMEDSTVARRDCEHCHNQPKYFERWREPLTLDLVEYFHAAHVSEQKAKCLDCHSEIHHQLVRKEGALDQSLFLTSVMANCMHCHPNQHAEQIHLLSGQGGTGVKKSDPNMMFGSRTNCFGCHVDIAHTEHGGVVRRGALSGCVECHGDRHSETFEKWKLGLEISTTDADDAYARASQLLADTAGLSDDVRRRAAALLGAAAADLALVRRGNGIHNVTYSMELLDSVTSRANEAAQMIEEAAPSAPEEPPPDDDVPPDDGVPPDDDVPPDE